MTKLGVLSPWRFWLETLEEIPVGVLYPFSPTVKYLLKLPPASVFWNLTLELDVTKGWIIFTSLCEVASNTLTLLLENEEAYFTNGYGIYFRQDDSPLFSSFSNPLMNVENIDVVQKILNSDVMHYYISKTSVSIEGGYPCYQKNFIEKFTIPDFRLNEITTLREIQSPEEINSFINTKYGLNIKLD